MVDIDVEIKDVFGKKFKKGPEQVGGDLVSREDPIKVGVDIEDAFFETG